MLSRFSLAAGSCWSLGFVAKSENETRYVPASSPSPRDDLSLRAPAASVCPIRWSPGLVDRRRSHIDQQTLPRLSPKVILPLIG